MGQTLVLQIHVHDARFHGGPEWPPSPARVFQALIAGASTRLAEPEVLQAFHWLEQQPPPIICAPTYITGQRSVQYVPSNDLDAVGGTPERTAEIRVKKLVEPKIFHAGCAFLYGWAIGDHAEEARQMVALAQELYQLGRGVDMASAEALLVDTAAFHDMVEHYPGTVHRPTPGARGQALLCPQKGTFSSLITRYDAQGRRFGSTGAGRKIKHHFAQPPRGRFEPVPYDGTQIVRLYDIRNLDQPQQFAPVPLAEAHAMTVAIRDEARQRLHATLPDASIVDAVLLGRRPSEPPSIPSERRVRLIPLPSIGHPEADPQIRRLAVEIPLSGPLAPADLAWAFSELRWGHRVLVDAEEDQMLLHYKGPQRRWQTVTPMALPAVRRRIDPTVTPTEVKDAPERLREESDAIHAVRQALRHARVDARAVTVSVQREPSWRKGSRAEVFAAPPRFNKERLWHVEITLDRAVEGPLVLGDGRFLGLGILRPVPQATRTFLWQIVDGLLPESQPSDVARALRSAVLSRAQQQWGDRPLPSWVTGHQRDGQPATGHRHLAYVFDPVRQRLCVDVPGNRHSPKLDRALGGLRELRAGRAGRLSLVPISAPDADPLLAPSCTWRSLTPYRVMRHAKRSTAAHCVEQDARRACAASGLPEPLHIEVKDTRTLRGQGLEGWLDLTFRVAVAGPLLLGRTRHQGGGVFEHGG